MSKQTISAARYRSIVVLTGAGISRASGLPTFRGGNGIWDNPETAKLSSIENLSIDPDSYWAFWGKLKKEASEAEPNAAHTALAQWQAKLTPEQKFTLITQNVDELHQRAGSKNVVELHGSAYLTRCSNHNCKTAAYRDSENHLDKAPVCSSCGSALRPDMIMFNEYLPPHAEHASKKSLRDCDLFIAIGTSGNVSPASQFVDWAKYAGARTFIINEDISNAPNSFDEKISGLAEKILPELLS